MSCAVHLRESCASESSAGVADVDEATLIVVAQQESADVLPRISRLGESADDELLAELDLQLEPRARAIARLVDRVDSLGDDSFPPLLLCERKHLLAVTFDRFGNSNHVRGGLAELLEESRAPLVPRLSDENLVIDQQDVEEHERRRRRAAMPRDEVRFLHVHAALNS